MTQRERESLTDADPHSLLFGTDDDYAGEPAVAPRLTRADRRVEHPNPHRRHRRRGRLVVLLAVVLVAAVAVLIVPRLIDYFRTKDYSGNGSGSVRITVHPNDSASDIGNTLFHAGVVASVGAFKNAASANSKAQNIQPGTYILRRHMSGKSALALLLDPRARDTVNDVVVTEGATVVDVEKGLVKVLGSGKRAAIVRAIENTSALGLPIDYRTGTRSPVSPEGFLYPATYTIDPAAAPRDILQTMVTRFTAQDRGTGFTDAAKQLGSTPYQALIIASIAQAEAKYAADLPKVARVILNRIKARKPLQIDATSAYAPKLKGLDPSKVIYADVKGPYNTYNHTGLPPTPIDNPGSQAMDAAVHPATGNWLYYVNRDQAGHLFFTSREKQFVVAAARCKKNHWGCG
ncbi:MAG: endolytic transglycosylase MltG [Actinomycetota bacterium]|nr:endolytic transglycosylase MltG [Actinomycetota bacterium]